MSSQTSRVLLGPPPAAAAFKSIFAAARPRAASLAPAGQFTFCTWRKYFDPHAGGVHTSARFGAPAKAVLLWGKEKQTERCSLSPQAEANGVQLVLTRCGGSKGGAKSPLYLSSRHATPGSSLPSRNSREAPLDTAEAPPAAEKARLCRGSGTIGGPGRGRKSSCRDGG